MIKVTVFQDSDGIYCGISLSGHAGYADYGQDIVCAAASVLALNTANSIEKFTDDKFEADIDEKEGNFSFRFTSNVSSESRLLMNSLILGLEDIKSSYGKQYIKIRFKEV